jgi:hypothetical protein
MTEISIGTVGVVISYVGEDGVDVTGSTFKHGNLVSRGQKEFGQNRLDLVNILLINILIE